MKKKRLIFTLLYENGYYMLSRNFRLQRVGDANWINNNYNFKKISFSIDELIILDVSRKDRDINKFIESFRKITDNVFVPVSIGGGIRSYDEAKLLFQSGADKIVLNTSAYQDTELVERIADEYGAQSVVVSIDVRKNNGSYSCYVQDGSQEMEEDLYSYLSKIKNLNIGEIYLNSIDKDGTGQNYDIDLYESVADKINFPLIAAGGAGKAEHFIESLSKPHIDAVATANLFNFIGNALPLSREAILSRGLPLAKFKD